MPIRIALQTWGSNGDIRPMLALAQGLVSRGHAVTLVVSSLDNRDYAEEAELLGIAYRRVPEHFDLDLEDLARRCLRMSGPRWLRTLLELAFFPYEALIYQTALELADSHDLLIGHHFLYPLKLAARQRGKPHVSVTLCPAAIASPAQPPIFFPDWGPWWNRWFWALMNIALSRVLRPITRLWREHGQGKIRRVFADMLSADQLDLVAVDPLFNGHLEGLAPHRVCGFFNLEEDIRRWTPPDGLRAFLEAGEAPIYCTFGSFQQTMPEWSMDLFVEAVRRAGCRAVVQTSSARFPADSARDGCYFIGRHPHQPVFERCRAVVHHGGAGTTHAATRAGCISVVVPFIHEQMYWGQSLRRLGLAPASLHAKDATADKLAMRIRAALASDDMARKAQAARENMVGRDGVEEALRAIEAVMASMNHQA